MPRAETLERTLAALARQTDSHELFEVVVVDEGSASPLPEWLRSTPLNVKVVRQERHVKIREINWTGH